MFCPFIKDDCRTDCVFCKWNELSEKYICSLADINNRLVDLSIMSREIYAFMEDRFED